MDQQDHKKITSSVPGQHEGHLCHKCGWPFPNPHPSAKLRRAHKRVCGTIGGYRLLHPEENLYLTTHSDDDHSDEDHRTPSSEVGARTISKIGSGGNGCNSKRLEDEVFSDAVTEFQETISGLGIDGHLSEVINHPNKMEKIIENDQNSAEVLKDSSVFDSVQPSGISPDSSKLHNPEVLNLMTDLSRCTQETQYHESSLAKEAAVMPSDDRNPIEPETLADIHENRKINDSATDLAERSTTNIMQEIHTKGNEESNLDRNVLDVVVQTSGTASGTSEAVSMSVDSEKIFSSSLPPEGVVHMKEEQSNKLATPNSSGDFSAEDEFTELMDASVDLVQIKMDAAQGRDLASSIKSPQQDRRTKDGNENVHVVFVPGDSPIIENAENKLEKFTDYKEVKLHQPVFLDLFKTFGDKEDDLEDLSEKSIISFQSRQGTEVSASDVNVVKDNTNYEVGRSKPLDKEVPIELKSASTKTELTNNEELNDLGGAPTDVELGAPKHNATTDIEESCTIRSPEEQQSHDISNDSSQRSYSGAATDVADTNKTTKLVVRDVAGNHEKATTEICDIAGNEEKKRAGEESFTESTVTAAESLNSFSESHVIPTTNLLDSSTDHGMGKMEKNEVPGIEIREGPMEEIFSMKTQTMPRFAAHLGESQIVSEDVRECSQVDTVSDSQGGVKKLEIKDTDKVPGEIVSEVSLAAESYHGNMELLPKASEACLTEEPLFSFSNSESSIQCSPYVETRHAREFGGTASGISSQCFQGGVSDSFVRRQLGASARDVSGDSYSQTDSVEGRWGSVSAISTQSDTQAVTDAEDRNNLQKSKAPFEVQHSDKSELVEPPSFMTLVQPGSGSDQKAAEIQTVHSSQQPNAASLQAGWFPSLTHVANESQGRKKNEESMVKVTNWSTGKQHTPLKLLLGEANLAKPKSPTPKKNEAPVVQNDENAANDSGAAATKVFSSLGPHEPVAEPAVEIGKEWNSPARYPAGIKREKRKVKGRPYWVQFVCCSSVN
ncbi:hypothetical protein CFOL_v3_02514 [Cephalotus follicularis]|uniref:Uncharacterized protein n=1 Tax=Cephalotus follicularis TaxID=3775 RepID=A0A1Q3ATC0_CEPFO|nr:hypothetical protein CFOL_v3_02514 [Cephalotus follicularis]